MRAEQGGFIWGVPCCVCTHTNTHTQMWVRGVSQLVFTQSLSCGNACFKFSTVCSDRQPGFSSWLWSRDQAASPLIARQWKFLVFRYVRSRPFYARREDTHWPPCCCARQPPHRCNSLEELSAQPTHAQSSQSIDSRMPTYFITSLVSMVTVTIHPDRYPQWWTGL